MKKNFAILSLGLAAVMVILLMGKPADAVTYGKSKAYLDSLGGEGIDGYNVPNSKKAIYWAAKTNSKETASWYVRADTYFQNYSGYTLYYDAVVSVNYNYLTNDGMTLHAGGGGGGWYPTMATPYIALSISRDGDLYTTFDWINLDIYGSGTLHWVNDFKKSMPHGTATVNSGQTLITNYLFRQKGNNYQDGAYTVQVNSGGVWAMNSMVAMSDSHNTDDALAGFGGNLYIKGDGLVVVSKDDSTGGTGQIEMNASGGGGKVYIQMGGNGTLRIESGCRLRNGGWNGGDNSAVWTDNYANLDNNGEFQFWDGSNHVYVGGLSGSGRFYSGNGGANDELIIGRNNAGGTFSGAIEGSVKVIKEGSGTQEFASTRNTFTNGLVINGGSIRFYCEHGNETVKSLGSGDITMANNTEIWAYHTTNDDAPTNVHHVAQKVTMTGAQGTLRSGHGNFLQFDNVVTGDRVNIASDSGYVVFNNTGNRFNTLHIGNGLNNWTDANVNSAARVVLAADNVIGNGTTAVEFEHISGPLGVNYLDMNGHSATISRLVADANAADYTAVKNGGSANSTLTINMTSDAYSYSGKIQDNITIVKTGNGRQYFDGESTYTGGTRITGGVLGTNKDTGYGTGDITLNNGTLMNHGAGSNPSIANNVILEGTGSVRIGWTESSFVIRGKVSGAGQLQVANDGPNYLVLANGDNDWTGGLQVGGGINPNADNGQAYARLGANGHALGSGVLSFGGVGPDNVFDMWGYSASGVAGLSSVSGLTSVLRDSQGNGVLTLNTTANYEYFGAVAGGICIVKEGASNTVQYLRSSSADWNGSAVVKGGVLAVEKNDGFGTAVITLDGGSIHNRAADVTLENQIEMGTNGGGLRAYGEQVFTINGYITDGVENAGALIIDADSGIVVIGGTNNDYTGGTVIGQQLTQTHTAAYLKLANNGYHLGSGAVSFAQGNGAYLDMNGANEEGIGGLSSTFSDTYVKNTGTDSSLTLNVASGKSYTFNGLIQDGITLVKDGEGTQIIAGANTYTGGTSIAAGTLQLGAENAMSTLANSSALTMTGGTLNMAGFNQELNTLTGTAGTITSSGSTLYVNAGEFAGAIQDAVALTKNTDETLILSGINTYTGATTVSAGWLQLDEAGEITVSDYDIASGAELRYNNTEDKEATNFFAGSGIIRKQGENVLLLSGETDNTFDGEIWVNGGTLQVASSFAEAYGYVDGCTLELLPNGVLKNVTVQKGNVVVDGGTITDTLTIEDSSSDDDPSVVKSGTVDNAVITLGKLDVEGGNVNTANLSDNGELNVTDNGAVTTLEQTGGEANVEGGTVETANLSDGKTTVSGGTVATANLSDYGDLTVTDNGEVTTLEQTGGLASVEGGTVETANLSDGETTVSGGEVVTANLSDNGNLTVTDAGVVSTLEQTGGEALVEGGEVTAANLSDGELTVAEDGEVGTLTQTGGDSYITGGEVELANLSDGNLSVSDYGVLTTLNQSGGESEISGGEVETANLSDGVLTVSEDGEVSMLSQTGGDSYITGGKVEDAELSGNTLNLSDDGELGTLTQTAGTANITGGKVKDSISLSGDDSVLNISGGKVNDVYQEAGTTNVTGGKVTGDFSLSGDNSVLNISDDGNVSTVYQESGTTNISGDSQVGSLLQDAGVTNISGGTTDSVEIVDGTLTMTGGVVESLFQDDGAMTISGGEVTELYQLGGTTEIKDDAVVYSGMLYGGETQMNGGTAGDMMLLQWDEATEGNLTVENAEILNLYQENGTATVKDSTLGSVSLLGGELTIEGGVVEETLAVTDGLSEWDETPLTGGNLTLLKDNEVPNLVVDAGNVVIAGSTIDVLDISGGRVTTDDLLDEILDNISIGDVSMDGGYLSLVELDEVGSLTLDRGATLELLLKDEMDVAAVTMDKVDLNGGSLVLNLQEGQSFKAGDTYQLFSAANGITGDAVDNLSKLTQVIIKDAEGAVKMKLDSGILPAVLQVTDNNTVLQFYVDPNIVPEPGTWMLLALGLLGLGAVSRRKRAKVA